MKIEYRPGAKAVVPDALSRVPDCGGSIASLTVEPGFLARVSRAQLDASDTEMANLVPVACSQDDRYFFETRHGVELMFWCAAGQAA